MITEKQVKELASHWIEAWNSHNLDVIMSHYDEEVVLTSPVAQKILNSPSGIVKGKDALKAYFAKGLELIPDLKFELIDVMWGVNSLVLYYMNQRGTKVGEYMEFDPSGKVVRVVANYNE